MTFYALYRSTADVVGHHHDRESAVRHAVRAAVAAPDLSLDVGIVEIDDDTGSAVGPFVSASELLDVEDAAAIEIVGGSGEGFRLVNEPQVVPDLLAALEASVAEARGSTGLAAERRAAAGAALSELERAVANVRWALAETGLSAEPRRQGESAQHPAARAVPPGADD